MGPCDLLSIGEIIVQCRPMRNKPVPFIGIKIGIPILRPLEGGGLLIAGLHQGVQVQDLEFEAGFRVKHEVPAPMCS